MRDIQKGVPLPKPVRRPSPKKYPFETMVVGDMFFAPHRERSSLGPYISRKGRRLDKKFMARVIYMRDTLEGWETCPPEDPRAVRGVGVWRTA